MREPRITATLSGTHGYVTASNLWSFEGVKLKALGGWHGGVSVMGESTQRLGHGQFQTPGRRAARVLSMELSRAADTDAEVERFRRWVSSVVSTGEPGTLTVDWDGQVLSSTVYQDGEAQVSHHAGYASLLLPLRAPDPCLYGQWREVSLKPIGSGVGFEFPPFKNNDTITFGSAIATDEWLWNDGNSASYPQFRVVADAPGGFRLRLGGKQVTYPWPVFKNTPVLVDMAGAVLVGGVDQSHLLGERGWGSIPPSSIESVKFDFLRGGEGWAIARTRDTFI